MSKVEDNVTFGDYYKDKGGFVWRKIIVANKHRHSISDTGLVYNVHTGRIKDCEGKKYVSDYKTCILASGKRGGISAYIHSLVALAFLDKPESDIELVVDHIDNDKYNNKASNLQWVTRQRNSEKSLAKNWTLISPEGKVVQIYNLGKFCRENDLPTSTMYFVAGRLRKEYKGWRGVKCH